MGTIKKKFSYNVYYSSESSDMEGNKILLFFTIPNMSYVNALVEFSFFLNNSKYIWFIMSVFYSSNSNVFFF